MKLLPRIEYSGKKELIGRSLSMSIEKNRTSELWKRFLFNSASIDNRVSTDFISLQIYPSDYFKDFDPQRLFEKWACVEVSNFSPVPVGLKPLVVEEGLYAVFDYKGSSSDTRIFQYIFSEWLPNSPYQLDQRPHFEVLGENYENNNPNSQEEIWIPIREI